jgi:predicted mannosyl-3-phosphoglycerate phosphatase (HAD superfamily)
MIQTFHYRSDIFLLVIASVSEAIQRHHLWTGLPRSLRSLAMTKERLINALLEKSAALNGIIFSDLTR